jgi:oxygen-independent coproporphyrinogen-3 oxidase
LSAAGLRWYEVSNWARAGGQCRHNLLYWTGGDWWGLGPGAHSHVGGVRWWNVKHPNTYARRLSTGDSPAQAREVLSGGERRTEDVMLRTRLAEGLSLSTLDEVGRAAAATAVEDGRLDATAYRAGLAVLTLHGRLLADAVARDLLG